MALSNAVQAQLDSVTHALTAAHTPWFDDNPLAWEGPVELGTASNISPWDIVSIMGMPFKGDVTGKVATKLAVKPRAGKPGSTLTTSGPKDLPITIKLYLFTPDDLARYVNMINVAFARTAVTITPVGRSVSGLSFAGANSPDLGAEDSGIATAVEFPPQTKFNALVVLNPKLAVHGITQLYLEEVDLITLPGGGKPGHVTLLFHLFSTNISGQKISATPQKANQTPPPTFGSTSGPNVLPSTPPPAIPAPG